VTVVITPLASRDLDEIRAYIAMDDPVAAEQVARRLLKAIKLIDKKPAIGRPSSDGRRRIWSVPGLPYVIPYRVRGERVIITRVFHTSRRRPKSLS
jgi:plasmid stabilization system protein ParE